MNCFFDSLIIPIDSGIYIICSTIELYPSINDLIKTKNNNNSHCELKTKTTLTCSLVPQTIMRHEQGWK